MIPGLKGSFQTISIAQRLVEIALVSARPAFELQFFRTQNAVLDRMDAEIAALNEVKLSGGATALLETQISSLERSLDDIRDYEARTKTNDINVQTALDQITTLKGHTTPSTVAEFEAAKTQLIDTLNKINTPFFEIYGAPDRLRQRKADALADLEALVHNNFATQGDIDAVNLTLDNISLDLTNSKAVTKINRDMSFELLENTESRISDLQQQLNNIQIQAQGEQLEKIEAKRQHFANILTAISLSFEAAQNITNFVAQNTVIPREIPPGSVLNLFS